MEPNAAEMRRPKLRNSKLNNSLTVDAHCLHQADRDNQYKLIESGINFNI